MTGELKRVRLDGICFREVQFSFTFSEHASRGANLSSCGGAGEGAAVAFHSEDADEGEDITIPEWIPIASIAAGVAIAFVGIVAPAGFNSANPVHWHSAERTLSDIY